ncbi:hypothetical protein Sme01_16290 [Sphaerisporangium melleum]|uniref:Uncharacterized protein n=1 Tax=Sphaerisporangium melleum TaxID=321316 RepID=A0A917RMN3_9ACTN|nr:WXG100 family type VII secretion target [Sphaerisporangium melleum]GGL14970.1 hypothetical protein GCM10007964_66270 [Sphaerisporangium melleum]GII69153.1 hypothetical protein Sme01_16290 [Sphaerisporangium melleum]
MAIDYRNIRGSRPETGVQDGDVGSVRNLLNATNPGAVHGAGAVHLTVAETIASSVEALHKQLAGIEDKWEGDSGAEFKKAVEKLKATGGELSAKMQIMGGKLQTYSERLTWYRENAIEDSWMGSWENGIDIVPGDWGEDDPNSNSSYFTDSRNSRARHHLENLNKEIAGLYDEIPARIEYDLPQMSPVAAPGMPKVPDDFTMPGSDGGGYGGGGPYGSGRFGGPGFSRLATGDPDLGSGTGDGTTLPGVTGPGAGTGGPGGTGPGTGTGPGNGTGTGPGGTVPPPGTGTGNGTGTGLNPNDPRTTDLAGFDPKTGLNNPALNVPNPNPTGLPTPTTSLGNPNGVGTVPIGTGVGAPGGTGTGLGTSYGAGSLLGGPNGQNLTRGIGANAAGMGGMPFMPMSGAGGGENQERERSTWLTGDEDDWGTDRQVAPGIIC